MKKISIISVILVLCLTLFGCSSNSNVFTAKVDDKANDKVIKIGITQWPGSYVWYGVEKMGIFEQNGVKATVEMFPVYSDAMNALASGNLDVFLLSYSDAIAPYNNGGNFKIVMVEDYSAGSDGIVVKPEITSLEGLKGRTVATEIGTVDQMFLYKCLEKANLTPKDINLVNMSIGDAGNAFIAGQVDAAVIWDPSLSMAVESGGKLLYTTKDTPGLIPAVMAVNGDTLKNRREDIKKIMNSWYDGLKVIQDKPDQFVKTISEAAEISVEDFESLMKGVKLASLEENSAAFEDTQEYSSLTYCGMEHAKFLKNVGMIDKIPENLRPLIDGSLLSEIVMERK